MAWGGPLQTSSYLEVEKSASLGEGHIMEAKEGGSEGPGGAGGLLTPVRTRGHAGGWPGLGGPWRGPPGAPGARPRLRQGLFFSPPREAGKYTKLAVKIFTQQQFWEEFGMLI